MRDPTALRSPSGPAHKLVSQVGAPLSVTIILPAFNEELAIGSEILRIREALAGAGINYELIVVDDGSEDQTVTRALEAGARVLMHVGNHGYGASLKTGILAASHDVIVISDADGTYPPGHIPTLLAELQYSDMVVGARTGANVNIPLIRRPAKWILNALANQIAGQKIPDLNSGLRCFRRGTVLPYFSLLPNQFSFTTTITLALLGDEYRVVYLPIDYHKRIGKSKITPWHFMEFMILVLRMSMLFQPLRVFLPLAFTIAGVGLIKMAADIGVFLARHSGDVSTMFTAPVLSTSALVLFSVALQLGVLGLVADGVIRRIVQQNSPLPASHAVRVVESTGAAPTPPPPPRN
jgi:glycosyltransferase involved in cell wall biosynthesis